MLLHATFSLVQKAKERKSCHVWYVPLAREMLYQNREKMAIEFHIHIINFVLIFCVIITDLELLEWQLRTVNQAEERCFSKLFAIVQNITCLSQSVPN